MNQLTVKDLLEFIKENNIPLDAIVKYQRIEDCYFNLGSGWTECSTMKPDEYNMGEDQYVDAFACVKYPDDNNLYLTSHY